MLFYPQKTSRFMMIKEILTIPIIFLLVSCGVENVNKITQDEQIDTSSQIDKTPSQELTEESPYFNDVVAQEESDEVIEQETSETEGLTDTTDRPSYTTFTGVIYKEKNGGHVFINSNGFVYTMDELSYSAQSKLNEISFPKDAHEVVITGSRLLTTTKTQSSYTFNDFSNTDLSIKTSYHFYLDEIEIIDSINHPQREQSIEQYPNEICGDIYIDQFSTDENIVIRNNETSHQVAVPQLDIDDIELFSERAQVFLNLKEALVNDLNGETKGCIYSSEAPYRDYSITWRPLFNAEHYDLNW